MAKGRDDFDKLVADTLMKRAAFICSNPDCKRQTIAPSRIDSRKFIYIGKAAHIAAAAEGGPRFEKSMSSEERKSIDNGIFLCSNCADMIDKNNGIDFSVELLHDWKITHDSRVGSNLNKLIQKQDQPAQVVNVTSNNQSGGVTAGVVVEAVHSDFISDNDWDVVKNDMLDNLKSDRAKHDILIPKLADTNHQGSIDDSYQLNSSWTSLQDRNSHLQISAGSKIENKKEISLISNWYQMRRKTNLNMSAVRRVEFINEEEGQIRESLNKLISFYKNA